MMSFNDHSGGIVLELSGFETLDNVGWFECSSKVPPLW